MTNYVAEAIHYRVIIPDLHQHYPGHTDIDTLIEQNSHLFYRTIAPVNEITTIWTYEDVDFGDHEAEPKIDAYETDLNTIISLIRKRHYRYEDDNCWLSQDEPEIDMETGNRIIRTLHVNDESVTKLIRVIIENYM